jgi:hypothetical protein
VSRVSCRPKLPSPTMIAVATSHHNRNFTIRMGQPSGRLARNGVVGSKERAYGRMVGHSEVSFVATWMNSRLLVEVTKPQPLNRRLMELRPTRRPVLGSGNDRRTWQRFFTLRAPFCPKVRIHFAEVTRFGFPRTIVFLALEFSESCSSEIRELC